jgi:hypothetical protein
MPFITRCPACGKQARAPSTAVGKMLRCPQCGQSFSPVPLEQATPAPQARPQPAAPVTAKVADTRPCPFCAEPIQAAAKKCKHCGEMLDPTLRAAAAAQERPRREYDAVVEEDMEDEDYEVETRRRKADRTDAPGVISLIFGCISVVCLLLGCVTCGVTLYAGTVFAALGAVLGLFGRGNLRVAGLVLNLLALIPAAILAVLLGMGVLGGSLLSSLGKNERPSNRGASPVIPQGAGGTLSPSDQDRFVKVIDDYAARYREAPNEIQQTQLRSDRAAAIRNLVGRKSVSNWTGTLKRLETDKDGTASIVITVSGANGLTFRTNTSKVFDTHRTVVERDSSVYRSLAGLTEGQAVVFSGEFVTGDDNRDYLDEMSMTERGAMIEPEFLMRFTAIRKK